MEIAFIFIGLFFMFIGVAAKKYPDMISGYNTMSPQKKRQIDVDKMSSAVRNMLFITGWIFITGAILAFFIGYYDTIACITCWGGIGFMILASIFYLRINRFKKKL